MSDAGTAEVFVVLGARGTEDADDRAFLLAAAGWALGTAPGALSLARHCPTCGGTDHGRPSIRPAAREPVNRAAREADAGRRLEVSLSRAGTVVAVALSFAGPVGIDIEGVAAVSRADFDDVAFNALEREALRRARPQDAPLARARMWSAKEATLKAVGVGLRVDPTELTVLPAAPTGAASPWGEAGLAASALTVTWDRQPPDGRLPARTPRLVTFDAGPGLVGALAVCGTSAPGGTAAPVVRMVAERNIRDLARPRPAPAE